MTERIITAQDGLAAGVCVPGMRLFCKRYGPQHGFTWRQFLAEGLPESTVLATGDAIGLKVVEVARGKQ